MLRLKNGSMMEEDLVHHNINFKKEIQEDPIEGPPLLFKTYVMAHEEVGRNLLIAVRDKMQ